jgi:hypothetical protein
MSNIKYIQEALNCNLSTAEAIEAVMYDYLNPPDYSESSLRTLKKDFLMVAELANITISKD